MEQRATQTHLPHIPRLLVVDDEPCMLSGLERLYRGRYDIVTASGVGAAMEALRRDTDYEAILCDMKMPDRSGPQMRDEVRAFAPRLADRFVFMSGSGGPPLAADLFLRKPFSDECLANALRALGGRKARRRPHPVH